MGKHKLFQHSLYIREQLEHNSYFTFCLGLCVQAILAEHRKLHPARSGCLEKQTHTHISSILSATHSLISYKIVCYSFANLNFSNFSILKEKKALIQIPNMSNDPGWKIPSSSRLGLTDTHHYIQSR